MRLKEHIKIFGQSCAPNNYRKLTAHKTSSIVRQFFTIFAFFMLLMILVSIPKLVQLPSEVERFSDSFDTFQVELNISMNEPLAISEHPSIVIDLNKTNRSKEFIILNDKGIIRRTIFGFDEKFSPWSKLKDVKTSTKEHQKLILIIIYLLIPSLIIFLSLLFLAESAILIPVMWTFGFIGTRIFRFRISKSQLWKIAILTWEAPLFIQMILFPYARFFLIPMIFFILLFTGSVWMTGQSRFEKK